MDATCIDNVYDFDDNLCPGPLTCGLEGSDAKFDIGAFAGDMYDEVYCDDPLRPRYPDYVGADMCSARVGVCNR